MNLPDLDYECVHCGYACEQFDVELTGPEFDNIRALAGATAVAERENRLWMRREPCGSCNLLLARRENRCGLQDAHGFQAKPRPCKEFPFRLRSTPGGVFVGASFACTAILEGRGPRVSAESLSCEPPVAMPMPELAPGMPFDWQRYLLWEESTLQYLRELGGVGLWRSALERSAELLGEGPVSNPGLEGELEKLFRGLLALAEGPLEADPLVELLTAVAGHDRFESRLVGATVDVADVMARWQEPWEHWQVARPFFEHMLFRKYLLEGPDVHSRLCSLPLLAQLLQFLTLARSPQPSASDARWAIRQMESKLTYHARGLDGFLGRCGVAFLTNLHRKETE